MVEPTASGWGRLVRNQRAARSSSRRDTSTMRSETAVGICGDDRRSHSSGRSNTAVTTENARTESSGLAPTSSSMRNAYVMPAAVDHLVHQQRS